MDTHMKDFICRSSKHRRSILKYGHRVLLCCVLITAGVVLLTAQSGKITDKDPKTAEAITALDGEKNILFVGNSLVIFGNIPEQLRTVSEMYGVKVNYRDISKLGVTLGFTKTEAIRSMESNRYDYVVLQEHGVRIAEQPSDFLSDLKELCAAARASGAIPVFYSPSGMRTSGARGPDKDIQAALTLAYTEAISHCDAKFVNAGEAWIYAYDKHSHIDLFADSVHANGAGGFFTAAVFASTLFNLHIKDIPEPNRHYNGDDALILGQAAWEYVSYLKENNKAPAKPVTVKDGTNSRAKNQGK